MEAVSMADRFFKEEVINCTLLTEANADESIFVYQCSAETNRLRDVITVTHLLFLLMGCIMVGVIDFLGWAACCCGRRRGCCFGGAMRRMQENLLPRVPGFLAYGVSRVPDFLDSSLQWSLRQLYTTVANPDTYPAPDSAPDVHHSGHLGPMRWRDAAARLVTLLLDEGAATPGPARKRPSESVRSYLRRLDSEFGEDVADAGLPTLDTPKARRPSRSVPTSAGRASSVFTPPPRGARAAGTPPEVGGAHPPSSGPLPLIRARSGLPLHRVGPSVSAAPSVASDADRPWAGPRSARPAAASSLAADTRGLDGAVLLAEAAYFSDSVWTADVFQDLSISLSRFFSILNDRKRRAADAGGTASADTDDDGAASAIGLRQSRRGLFRRGSNETEGFAMAAVFGGGGDRRGPGS